MPCRTPLPALHGGHSMNIKRTVSVSAVLILFVFGVILSALHLNIFIFAAGVNGISVSASSAAPGDELTVTVSVPPAQDADSAFIKVEFDASVFEVISWEPTIANGIYNSGEGFFVVTSANASRAIRLGSGCTERAKIAVKSGAPDGDYKFRLTEHSLSYIDDSGFNSVEVWQPDVTEVTVHIGKNTGSQGGNTSVTEPSRITQPNKTPEVTTSQASPSAFVTSSFSRTDGNAAPVTVTSTSRTTGRTAPPDSDLPVESDADTTTLLPDIPDADGELDLYGEGEEVEIPDDQPVDLRPVDFTADVPSGDEPAPQSAVQVKMHSELKNMTEGKITAAVNTGTFSGSIDILLTNTKNSEQLADKALAALGLSGRGSYAFDITLYDGNGGQMHSIPGGHVDFSLPLPKALAGSGTEFRVYHIDGSTVQLVSSDALSADGKFVEFRATGFSPYLIVGMTTGAAQPAQQTASVVGPGSGARNPHTGTTAAIALPAAFVLCFLLLRKGRQRKRKINKK